MAQLTAQFLNNTGVIPTLSAPTVSDLAPLGTGNSFAVYRNSSASPVTVTVVGQGITGLGDALPGHVYTLPATTGELWIPLRASYSNGTGNAVITTSAQSGVTCAVVIVS